MYPCSIEIALGRGIFLEKRGFMQTYALNASSFSLIIIEYFGIERFIPSCNFKSSSGYNDSRPPIGPGTLRKSRYIGGNIFLLFIAYNSQLTVTHLTQNTGTKITISVPKARNISTSLTAMILGP